MQWIIDNWLTVLLIVGMLAMHMFGHGHGGHGGHCGQKRERRRDARAGRDGTAEGGSDDGGA